MEVFKLSFFGAVLIIAVVIIRALTLHNLPKKTFLFLWGVVVCRLLIPISVPSRFSFYTGLDRLKQVLTQTTAFTASSEAIVIPSVVAGAENTIYIGKALSSFMVVWLAGMCACSLFFIAAYIKCRREFQFSLPIESDFIALWQREHPLRRTVQIRQSDRINAPLTYGVLCPTVLLPKSTDWTNEADLRVILTHEFVHIRRFDTLIKLLLTLTVCIHWFNPFVWVMYVLANRDIELSCDETVVQIFGETMKSAYAMMLIGMEEKKNKITPLCNSFSKNAIEERIVSIMKMKKASFWGISLACVLVLSTATAFATSANVESISGSQKNSSVLSTDLKISKEAISYDEYKAWMDNKIAAIQEMVRSGKWSQETADREIERYEQILSELENGARVSITADNNGKEKISVIPNSDFEISESVQNGTNYITISD